MKRTFPLLWLSIITSIGYLPAQVPNPGSEGTIPLKWASSYEQALKLAEAEKKPLVMDITTDWCGWSKKMDRETFAAPFVQKALKDCVLLRLNPEVSEANAKIAEKYGVDGYPTLVVANYKGEELGQQSGYQDAKAFLEFLKKYLALFKANPLGYSPVRLAADDPLMKAISRLPGADAMPTSIGSFLILDKTEITLQPNGAARYLIRSSYYIVDPEQNDLPRASMNYNSSREKARFKAVRILNTKGEGREVDVKLAKDEHAYSNQNVYWDVRHLGLDLPTFKEGQIIDIIEEKEAQPIIPEQFYFHWNTGLKMMLSSELTIVFPKSLKLEHRLVRCSGKVTEKKNSDGTLTWQLLTTNPQTMEREHYAPPYSEIWEGCQFYTPCKKETITQWFSGLCQGRDTLPEAAKQKIADLKRTNATPQLLLQAIMDWVTKDIRYVSVMFGASAHQPHPVKETLENLYGDCKDQSLLVQALCREAGLPASLVLLGAGHAIAFEEDSPAIEMFNHCIVEATAGGKTYYLDPAAGPSKIERLTPMDAGRKALKIGGDKGSIVKLPPYRPSTNTGLHKTIVKLNPNGSGTVTEITQVFGEQARSAKQQMKNTPAEKMRKYMEDSYKRSGRKLLDFSMTDPAAEGDMYESKISYSIPRYGSLTAGGLVFKLGAQESDSDWIASLNGPRTAPFRFFVSDPRQSIYEVELPPGAKLKSKPEDVKVDAPFMKASRKITFADNKLSVTEANAMLEARMEASEANKVYAAFRKLQDHREYAFIAELPRTSKR